LIRSVGGWDEVKKVRLSGQDRMKGEQRILGESMTGMARLLGLTQPAVGYAVERGERLAKKEKYALID